MWMSSQKKSDENGRYVNDVKTDVCNNVFCAEFTALPVFSGRGLHVMIARTWTHSLAPL